MLKHDWEVRFLIHILLFYSPIFINFIFLRWTYNFVGNCQWIIPSQEMESVRSSGYTGPGSTATWAVSTSVLLVRPVRYASVERNRAISLTDKWSKSISENVADASTLDGYCRPGILLTRMYMQARISTNNNEIGIIRTHIITRPVTVHKNWV